MYIIHKKMLFFIKNKRAFFCVVVWNDVVVFLGRGILMMLLAF
jgi:hypothetical protein